MNELTKRIWNEAAKDNESNSWSSQVAFVEKLVQLTAKECIQIVAREANTYEAPTWAYEIVNDIAESFEIEP